MAHSSLPKIGAKPLICVPSAARTCCEVSDTRASMLVIISSSRVSRSSRLQKPDEISQQIVWRSSNHHKLTRDLSGYSGADFSFSIFQQLDKCRDQITIDSLFIHSLCNL